MIRALYPSVLLVLFVAAFILAPSPIVALERPGEELSQVGFTPELGTSLDLSLPFATHRGESITLGDLFPQDRPVIIVPVYYRCPRLCGLVFNGLASLLNELKLERGKDYRVIAYSIDPTENVEDAKSAARRYGSLLIPSATEEDTFWSFLVGTESATKHLSDEIGFHYVKDGEEYAHGAGFVVVTPDGRVSQYFSGIMYSEFDVRLSLVEAAERKIGSPIDHIALFCYRFDPLKGKYTWAVTGLLRVGGAVTLLLLGGLITALLIRERIRGKKTAGSASPGESGGGFDSVIDNARN